MPLTDEDVREILRIIDESDLSELRIDTDGFSLHVVKGDRPATESPSAGKRSAPSEPAPQGEAEQPSPDPEASGLTTIEAPMLGTFYRAQEPGKPPFVEVGSRVEPDTIVCIIEVMKMMNSVPAGVSGTVAEVLPDNAELVEYGQPLFRVKSS
ncbi:MAG TPA: acetyl-CoA carboxylase biotin carboxyl carrier protein [Solirubrobacteraceae bacterium]|nr:acetyl-CoA carboxylase biotin carboxyl carrier protein [Solirubrobacteraceae bacterium]